MYKYLRMASLAATVAALATSPAFAASPSSATASPQAKAQVRILKPLTLAATADLDLGTVALGQGTFTATVGIAQDGTWTCTNTVTCSGGHNVATYHVTGTAGRNVTVTSGPVSLSNSAATLALTVDAPTTVALDSTGVADFDVGGSVALNQATPDGLYTGDFDITADYE